jgi:hypothetical protein
MIALDVVGPAFPAGQQRTSASAFIQGGLSALWSYHFSGLPLPPTQDFALDRAGVILLQPVPLLAESVDLAAYPLEAHEVLQLAEGISSGELVNGSLP